MSDNMATEQLRRIARKMPAGIDQSFLLCCADDLDELRAALAAREADGGKGEPTEVCPVCDGHVFPLSEFTMVELRHNRCGTTQREWIEDAEHSNLPAVAQPVAVPEVKIDMRLINKVLHILNFNGMRRHSREISKLLAAAKEGNPS